MNPRHEAAKRNIQQIIQVLGKMRIARMTPMERAIIQNPTAAKSKLSG